MKNKAWIAIAASAAVIIIVAAVLLIPRRTTDEMQEEKPAVTEPVTAAESVQPATQAETAAEKKPAVPKEIEAALKKAGKTAEDLEKTGCRQLITVVSDGSDAQIDFYRFEKDGWKKDGDLSCEGYVGHNGVTDKMREGGMATPMGLYPVGEAFYIFEEPETGLDIFKITEDTYWVDDPESELYNQRVEGSPDGRFDSAEHMIDYQPFYNYGFVIEYNTEAVPDAGSAIFFHYSNSPTMGCVGVSEEMTLAYLAALDKEEKPYILIG